MPAVPIPDHAPASCPWRGCSLSRRRAATNNADNRAVSTSNAVVPGAGPERYLASARPGQKITASSVVSSDREGSRPREDAGKPNGRVRCTAQGRSAHVAEILPCCGLAGSRQHRQSAAAPGQGSHELLTPRAELAGHQQYQSRPHAPPGESGKYHTYCLRLVVPELRVLPPKDAHAASNNSASGPRLSSRWPAAWRGMPDTTTGRGRYNWPQTSSPSSTSPP